MTKDRASATADVVATVRAYHARFQAPQIFNDTYAWRLLGLFWRIVLSFYPLRWLVIGRAMRPLHAFQGQILCRYRYTEDCLEEALGRGVTQYVVLGAGLDSFALRRRDLADRLRVFEVDHPATQAVKQERLAALREPTPDNLVWVPVDFEETRLEAALAAAGFSDTEPALFSWLGVLMYLTPEATEEGLKAIAASACPGSEVVLTFPRPLDEALAEDRPVIEAGMAFTAERGEPWVTTFTAAAFIAMAERHGYEVVELLEGPEVNARYLQGREDIRVLSNMYFCHLRTTAR